MLGTVIYNNLPIYIVQADLKDKFERNVSTARARKIEYTKDG